MALESIALFQKGLLLVVLLSAPALLAAVIFGVITSLVQTLIQVQDQTLPFAIKLVAVGIALFATGGWVASEMINLTNAAFNQIIYVK
ncbi:EscS/YscS/HrcS family type III secretion system export apparatus protein [Exilibacterium tricleocarpae]|uniref:EscS/YscS/HrcS family type III secretion system export apparatus protein n=1 Tax=Exilibacterium tricleocarpae TaxID=2591008 RepID=A0A545U3T7_9GAMM|nr:type III secretion system export apparatus subunit SctS [Exilibacterium tricleocarpae]TQV84084.1 EscS/YscS/HrcS family type III secretion system export apparatus protein [Exilibacterium tricleocarpae]